MRKIIRQIALLAAVLTALTSCVSTAAETVLTVEKQGRMFWKVSGIDFIGRPASVYILGTIHIGDRRLYKLDPEVIKIMETADRRVGELSKKTVLDIKKEILKYMQGSLKKYPGRRISDYLTAEENEILKKQLGNRLDPLLKFEPWVINMTLANNIYKDSGLNSIYGMDQIFMYYFNKKGVEWDGLDSMETQLNILTYGTYEEQILVLKDTLASIKNSKETTEYISKLYNSYLEDDEIKFKEAMDSDPSEKIEGLEDYTKRYEQLVLNDRNEKWVLKIKDYIRKGGTTFIFAGCGHFVGENSVIDILKNEL